MDLIDAIEKRVSRRSFLLTPIDSAHRAQLTNLITTINQENGLSIQWIEDGSSAFAGFRKSYGIFKNVRSFLAMVGKAQDEHVKEKIGYFGEQIVLEATKLGLGTCWVGGSFDRENCPYQKEPDDVLVCVIPIGNCNEERPLKEKTIYRLIHLKKKPIEDMVHTDLPVLPPWFLHGMAAVQKAPSAANRQPVIFYYENGQISAKVNEIDALQLTDLGIAKCHFEIAVGGRFAWGNGGLWQK